MKKTLVLLVVCIALLPACRKGPLHDLFQRKIKIKGQLERNDKQSGYNARTSSFSLDDASKVLLFYGSDYEVVNIKVDGSFSGKVPLGSATVLVFLTQNNEFIGNLFMKGLNFLPLTGLDESISTIDLSTLTQDSTRIIPANDPIGTQIILTQEELEFMLQVGSYYEALAKNLDMNQDGIVDVLQDKYIHINSSLLCNLGVFGVNQSPPSMVHDSAINYNHEIFMYGPNTLLSSTSNSVAESAIISGPVGNPHNDIQNAGNSYINNSEFKVNFGRAQIPMKNVRPPFSRGEYVLHIDNKQFPFHFATINMDNHAIILVPTLVVNGSNEVTSIEIEYRFRNGQSANPTRFLISGIDVNFSDLNYQISYMIMSDEGLPSASYDYYSITVPDPVPLSSLTGISLAYTDLFGNRIGNHWTRN